MAADLSARAWQYCPVDVQDAAGEPSEVDVCLGCTIPAEMCHRAYPCPFVCQERTAAYLRELEREVRRALRELRAVARRTEQREAA